MELKTFGKKERLAAYKDTDENETFIGLLFVPNVDKEEHFHIHMTEEEAAKLCNYLNAHFGNN